MAGLSGVHGCGGELGEEEFQSDFDAESVRPMAGLSAAHGGGGNLEWKSFRPTYLLRV